MTIYDEPGLDALSLQSPRSALYGAACFAAALLDPSGERPVAPSRVICTPDARFWFLAFGRHSCEVRILEDGLSIRSVPSAVLAEREER